MLSPSPKSKTMSKIIKCRNDTLDQLHADMNRLSARIDQINDKNSPTDAEEKEKQGLLDAIDQLVAVETHVILFSVGALDSTAEVRVLMSQVNAANRELAEVKNEIENLSKAIAKAGDFLKDLEGLLTTLAGLLKVLA